MRLGHRIAITFMIVLAMLFGLATCGYMGGRWEEAQGQETQLYGDIPIDATLLRLDRRALEEAYHLRLIKLFDIWLSGQQANDATQFQNGLRIARKGYNTAAAAIAKREQQLLEQEGQRK